MAELELEGMQFGLRAHDIKCTRVLCAQVLDLNCGSVGVLLCFCSLFSIDFYERSPLIKVDL